MSSRPGLLARVAAWFIEPAPVGPASPRPLSPAGPPRRGAEPSPGCHDPPESAPPLDAGSPPPVVRPLVAVCAIAPGCGATTVARALAAELAIRDRIRSAVVAGPDGRGALPLGTPAAARLARIVSSRTGAAARPSGRLCLAPDAEAHALERAVRGTAAVVVDADVRQAGAAASLADHVVLVAGPRTEPALAEIVAASLARVGPRPVVVLNRAPRAAVPAHASGDVAGGDRSHEAGDLAAKRWSGRADVAVPVSPPGARLALACRGAGGAFGAAIAKLADRCGAA